MPRDGGSLPATAGPLHLTSNARWMLLGLAVAALAIRIAAAVLLPNIVHQDETFQYLEQGHRLAFGVGLAPWEYIVGARSWAFPGLIAGILELARLFDDTPETGNFAVAVFMSTLSLSPVICGYLWGWRIGGLRTAIAVGGINAVWFELVYFAPHTLAENMAADALIAGLYCIYPGRPSISPKALALGGLLLGLAFIFRVQLAPAIAVAVIAICRTQIRLRYLPLLLGAALPVMLAGLLDGLTWDWPFQSMTLNFWINLKEGVAAEFSRAPPYQYLSLAVTYWSGAFALIVCLAALGGRRLPVLLLVALTIFAAHTMLSHKEYRFNYPALPLLITLVGVGSAEVAARIGGGLPWRGARLAIFWGVPAFWLVTSLILARSREFFPLWYRDQGSLLAMRIIDRDPAACGVGIYPADMWDRTGGYAHLKSGLTLYGREDGAPGSAAGAYDYLIGYRPTDFTDAGFTRIRCWAEPPGRTIAVDPICLWHRPGACDPAVAAPLSATPPVFLSQSHPEWFAKPPK
jgi:phosphatidylinositol glycan class B